MFGSLEEEDRTRFRTKKRKKRKKKKRKKREKKEKKKRKNPLRSQNWVGWDEKVSHGIYPCEIFFAVLRPF